MEEGSSGGRKRETTARGTNITLRMMCLMQRFLSCLQAVQDAQEKLGDQKWLGKSLCSASFTTKHTLV